MTLAEMDETTAAARQAANTVAPQRSRGRRWLVRLAVFAGLAYGTWCTALYFGQDELVFPRHFAPAPLAQVPPYVRELTVRTEAGHEVPGWFVRSRSASAATPGPAVLYFHGNGEIIDYESRIESLWRGLDASVLFAEFRGYGRAAHAGRPSEAALVADGIAFFDLLGKQPEVDPKRIIIHGYSLGGGVAAQVAAQRKPAALVLEATFTSIASFGWSYGVPPFLSSHPFRTDAVLPGLEVPIFIAHGRHDHIVPVEHGRELHTLVPASTYVELDCGHLNLPAFEPGSAYVEKLRGFLVAAHVLRE